MYLLGDLIICKIISADRVSKPVITTLGEGLGKLKDGICIQIDVPKVPRIIGKRGSMIKLLKDLTACRLFVSKNGMSLTLCQLQLSLTTNMKFSEL